MCHRWLSNNCHCNRGFHSKCCLIMPNPRRRSQSDRRECPPSRMEFESGGDLRPKVLPSYHLTRHDNLSKCSIDCLQLPAVGLSSNSPTLDTGRSASRCITALSDQSLADPWRADRHRLRTLARPWSQTAKGPTSRWQTQCQSFGSR